MDLQVSVVLLFIFLTGGYSLKCYSCSPDATGICSAIVVSCPDGYSNCLSTTMKQSYGSSHVSYKSKECSTNCIPTKQLSWETTVTVNCCETDLCNAADGVYKGSFLLLLSPLLFYFLFQ